MWALGGAVLALGAVVAGGAGQPRGVPPRWKYAIYTTGPLSTITLGPRTSRGDDELARLLGIDLGRRPLGQGEVLDALGMLGWELVSAERVEEPRATSFRFKRPL